MAIAVDPRDVITPRQCELVALYASGFTLDEIAEQKFLASNTVRQTLRVARERVGAKSLTHLAALCIDSGVIYKNGHGFKPLQVDGVVSE